MILLALAVLVFAATLISSGRLWGCEPDLAFALFFLGMCFTVMLAVCAIPGMTGST